jgi:hypothetical protein
MVKLVVFVGCNGWKHSGYINTLYFETMKNAEDWLFEHPYCEKLSLEEITEKEFAEDYIGSL